MKRPIILCLFTLLLPYSIQAQKTISGIITDEQGAPMAGAIVQVKGAASGTATDSNGSFELSIPDGPDTRIMVTFLGYRTQEIRVGVTTHMEIEMKPEAVDLSEVVVIGFGTQLRRQVTSSIAKIDPAVLEGVPATTINDALQGRLPGVVFSRSSGALGAAHSIRVRGYRLSMPVISP